MIHNLTIEKSKGRTCQLAVFNLAMVILVKDSDASGLHPEQKLKKPRHVDV